MTSTLDGTLRAALLALLVTPLIAQDPEAAKIEERNAKRVAGAKLELLRQWVWDKDGVPPLPAHPPAGRQPAVGRMTFSADGTVLALELGPSVFALEVPSGELKQLTTGNVALLGPAGNSDLLLRVGTGVWRFNADGKEQEETELEIPDRSDSWTSPFAPRLLECSMVDYHVSTYVVDLKSGKRKRLAVGETHPTALAWHPDGKLFAIAVALFGAGSSQPAEGIVVFDTSGAVRHRLDDGGQTVRTMDFSVDGRSLTWATDRIRRVGIDSGTELASAEGQPEFWANVDPVLAVSHDGNSLQLWDGVHLQRIFEIPLEERRPELPPKAIVGSTGVVLGTAITARRDLLAVATFAGLRLYRILP